MSELTKTALAADEAVIARRGTIPTRIGWLWPEVVALVMAGGIIGFCVGLVI